MVGRDNGTPVKNQPSTTHQRRILRWSILAGIAVVLVLIVAGCAAPRKPLTDKEFTQLGEAMVNIEKSPTKSQDALYDQLDKIYNDATKQYSPDDRARARFLQGYIVEYRATTSKVSGPQAPTYSAAQSRYQEAAKIGSSYGLEANYRLGVLAVRGLLGAESAKIVKASLSTLTHDYANQLWVREAAPGKEPPTTITEVSVAGANGNASLAPTAGGTTKGPVLQAFGMADTALRQLDYQYQHGGGLNQTYYRTVDGIVQFFGRFSPSKSVAVVLALFILALIVKVITAPLTTMAYRGMRDMQRIQPLLKELQAKYKAKEDRAKLAEEQMKLMKEHKVSPAGGCLPMLIQLPIFLAVYQAVMVYAFQFSDTHFLWINNLARPDMILLILYAISMIITQKLTTAPSVDPQQQVLQNQMTYMMPIFLVLVLASIASAFVLYWFFLNVLSAAHQYYLLRKFKAEEAAKDAAVPPAPEPPPPGRRKKGMK